MGAERCARDKFRSGKAVKKNLDFRYTMLFLEGRSAYAFKKACT
ncbi:hypothetical protein SBDP1_470033 [Syntrophobacter sp. SbD1]|nr:hypothetical protein SBDP1_470033 [Syntrophobacter sp. SbD1]